jgi:hypothetical protein
MKFDKNICYYIYPSWASFSYKWKDLSIFLSDPLATKYVPKRQVPWTELGYSTVTDNFTLIDGPFGNGIVAQDCSKIADELNGRRWLPKLVLMSEADICRLPGVSPPNSERYRVVYLSPKQSDEVLLGLKKRVDDPMPYCSLEPLEGLEHSALLCVGRTGSSALGEELKMLPLCLRAFQIKAELLAIDDCVVQECKHVHEFLSKWRLNGVWYFLDTSGLDAGLLLAIAAYLGGYLRSVVGSQIKSCHIITTLPEDYTAICTKWTMKRLR